MLYQILLFIQYCFVYLQYFVVLLNHTHFCWKYYMQDLLMVLHHKLPSDIVLTWMTWFWKIFTNRSLFANFWSLASGIISQTLTFYDFVTSIKSFRQHNSCVSCDPDMILNLIFLKALLPKIFVVSTITAVVP